MSQHIFLFESKLQNNQTEVAPSSQNLSLSVSEKLSRYGVNALSDVEHLGLLVGKETLAARLLAHFGSLKALTKASACDLLPFMTTHKAERLVAALAIWGHYRRDPNAPITKEMELQLRKLERRFFSQKSVQRFDCFPWFGRREPER